LSKSGIRFVAGFEPDMAVPARVRAGALTHRFAVIQDSYRSDSTDMYFDEALWLRLIEFAKAFAPGASVAIIEDESTAPCEPEEFLARWRAVAADDREPAAIVVRDAGRLLLYIEPEFWTRVGGPSPYHDSYTYALYSNEAVAQRVMTFLAQADAAQGWEMATEVLPPNAPLPFWKKVLQRFS
jgi:hypothetical protein